MRRAGKDSPCSRVAPQSPPLAVLCCWGRQRRTRKGRPPIRAIRVDVSALRTDYGDDTAHWVAASLPDALVQYLGPAYQPNDRNGAVLTARIDWVYLGPPIPPGSKGGNQDTIEGTLILSGPRGISAEVPLRATAGFIQTPVDVAFPFDANRGRIITLAKSFAAWTPRQLGL